MNDLHAVLGNIALIKATQALGPAQEHVMNPVGEALAGRTESAILDALPFHVYMVLPVYPEGTLNTLNIMNQVHLTMQSLVFGSNSLVNRIRRALVVRQLMKEKKLSVDQARRHAASYDASTKSATSISHGMQGCAGLNPRRWECKGSLSRYRFNGPKAKTIYRESICP